MGKTFRLSVLFFELIACSVFMANAQGGASINSSGAPPDPSAMIDVNSSNKGALIPRMSTLQRDSILNPAKGLFIYNTDCDVVNFNAGTPASPNWAALNSSNVITAGVTISANPVGAICAGTGVTFTATPAGGINSPTYQWQVNGVNAGANSAAYTNNSLNNGDVVTCILSASGNCVVGSPATSNAITMLVNIVPSIIGTTPGAICGGSAVTLDATADLGNINWYANSTGGSSLSSGSSYTVSGLSQTTTYYVDATANGCTTASRTAVTATYYPGAPGQPGSISGTTSGNINGTATYSVSAVSSASDYVWSVVCGAITSGQGTNSINVTWDSSGFGQVSVAASNPCGTSAAQTAGNIGIQVQLFTYTGVQQTFTVPNGASMLTFQVYGAQGGSILGGTEINNQGGLGGYATGTYNVSGGEILYISIGGAGNSLSGAGNVTNGGTNGGGSGYGSGTGGGGASDVRIAAGFSNRIIVAGGGGGVPSAWISTGGSGGGNTGGDPTGGAGGTGGVYNGQGGTQNSGGQSESECDTYGTSENGRLGNGGEAGNCQSDGGGGGGGYYGGGGGDAGPGGGGSGYIGGVNNGTMQNGVQSGNGQVIIYWQ